MTAHFDHTRPIYLQIMEEIKRRAVRGIYHPGGLLPSVRDLARETGVNPNTIARVYLELERVGFISTRRGQGTYLTEDPSRIDAERGRMADEAADRFVAEIRGLGLDERHITDVLTHIGSTLGTAKPAPSAGKEK